MRQSLKLKIINLVKYLIFYFFLGKFLPLGREHTAGGGGGPDNN